MDKKEQISDYHHQGFDISILREHEFLVSHGSPKSFLISLCDQENVCIEDEFIARKFKRSRFLFLFKKKLCLGVEYINCKR